MIEASKTVVHGKGQTPVAARVSTPWSAFYTPTAEMVGASTRGIGSQRMPSIAYVAGVGAGR